MERVFDAWWRRGFLCHVLMEKTRIVWAGISRSNNSALARATGIYVRNDDHLRQHEAQTVRKRNNALSG
jgi:predicted protein tyrosine phosphatase